MEFKGIVNLEIRDNFLFKKGTNNRVAIVTVQKDLLDFEAEDVVQADNLKLFEKAPEMLFLLQKFVEENMLSHKGDELAESLIKEVLGHKEIQVPIEVDLKAEEMFEMLTDIRNGGDTFSQLFEGDKSSIDKLLKEAFPYYCKDLKYRLSGRIEHTES